jgi:ligand-binding sensor domain-containing protein/anti-sigma regulatory factor (Ser/Thr protein kinase)
MINRVAAVMICFLILSTASSQQLKFATYTSANGLSQSRGICMAQDKLGYMWMGTQDGLNRFNGKDFVAYYKGNVKRGSIPANYIKALYYDSLNNWLWVGTASGLCIYNCRADSFYSATHYFPAADTLNGLMIRSIVAGRNPGEILVVTFSEGLFICNTKLGKHQQFFKQPDTKNSTEATVVWNKEILVVANKTLYRLNDTAKIVMADPLLNEVQQILIWQNKLCIVSAKYGLMLIEDFDKPVINTINTGSKDAACVALDKSNNLWLGTHDAGLIILEPLHRKILYSFANSTNQNEWPRSFTLSLFKDRQNSMWVGSKGGGFSVNTTDKNQFGLIQKSATVFGKISNNIATTVFKPTGNLLYTGILQDGLSVYNIATKNIEFNVNPASSPSNTIYGITASANNSVWLATHGGLFNFNEITKKFTPYIDSSIVASLSGEFVYKLKGFDSLLYSSARGTVFFNLHNKKFSVFKSYKDIKGVSLNLVLNSAEEDKAGNIWMGTVGHGLVKYNIATGAIKIVEEVKSFSNLVFALYNDNGILWVATSNGLLVYDLYHNKIIKTFTIANGMPGNAIASIEKDAAGNFWCGSNVGLIKIDGRTDRITLIKASAGLQSNEFNIDCSATDSNGNLYFGGFNGVSFFNPSKFSINQFSPQPLIESIKIANTGIDLTESVNYATEIRLSHLQNFITLEFGVTNFINHDECLYKYRMYGVDENWVDAGNRNIVNYAGLKPGKYVFQLQSCNSNGIWSSKITKLAIIISPAFWQTWWFILLISILAAAIIFMGVKKRIQNFRFRAATKQKIAETEMAALKAQMNPHFMFNCINSIDAFIHSNDKYNATLYLNKFAKLLRNILDSSKQNTVQLSKDVDTLQLYIELEELRHENKFSSNITVEEELLQSDYKVPPLIIQPFVENAILHGLKNKAGNDGVLTINIQKVGDTIKYIIEDNGIGRQAAKLISQTKESSYGMDMSIERIKLFNNEKVSSIKIVDLFEHGMVLGTSITVYLKID